MMRVLSLLLLVAGCAADAKLKTATELDSGNMNMLFKVLRGNDAMAVVMMYDSTRMHGMLHKEEYNKAVAQLELVADCYMIDVAVPANKWYGLAHKMKRDEGAMYLLYEPDTAAPSGAGLQRPGGVKQPKSYSGPPSQLKAWIQNKLPEPKAMRRITASSNDDVLAAIDPSENTLVVFTDKDKISPALKAIVLRMRHAAEKAVLVKVKDAEDVGLEKLPTLTKYKDEKRDVYEGKITKSGVEEFFGYSEEAATEKLQELAVEDSTKMVTAVKRQLNPVPKIVTQAEWDEEVMNDAVGLVLVAFIDDDNDTSGFVKTLVEVSKKRSSLKNVVWVPTSISTGIMDHFRIEPDTIIFISKKHGKWTQFRGAANARSILQFVSGPLGKGAGARDLGNVPRID